MSSARWNVATPLKGIARGVDQAAMALLGPLRRRMLLLVRDERGMALPMALFATIASFSLASAAVVASIDSQRGTTRDHSSKEAIAAADAGANVALLRLNRYASALGAATPCLVVNGSGALATTEADPSMPGWCPAVSGSVAGAGYSYRVTPQVGEATISVVSTGTSGDVNRRVDVALEPATAGTALSTDGMIGQSSITLSGNAEIHANIGTNGSIAASGNSIVCGDIRHGVGQSVTPGHQCREYSVSESEVTLPQVSSFIPTNISTNNFDYRLVTCTKTTAPAEPVGCQSDTYTGDWKNQPPWNPKTRAISLSGKEPTLTLGGGDYFICSLSLSGNSHLIMAAGSHVRVFFDTPENCGISNGGAQISMSGNSGIEATNFKPGIAETDLPGFYLLGSTSRATSIDLSGNQSTTNEFLIYAPNTDIHISGNAQYQGVLAGKTVTDSGNGTVTRPSGFEPPQIGGATLYSRQSYVECAGGAAVSVPNEQC